METTAPASSSGPILCEPLFSLPFLGIAGHSSGGLPAGWMGGLCTGKGWKPRALKGIDTDTVTMMAPAKKRAHVAVTDVQALPGDPPLVTAFFAANMTQWDPENWLRGLAPEQARDFVGKVGSGNRSFEKTAEIVIEMIPEYHALKACYLCRSRYRSASSSCLKLRSSEFEVPKLGA